MNDVRNTHNHHEQKLTTSKIKFISSTSQIMQG